MAAKWTARLVRLAAAGGLIALVTAFHRSIGLTSATTVALSLLLVVLAAGVFSFLAWRESHAARPAAQVETTGGDGLQGPPGEQLRTVEKQLRDALDRARETAEFRRSATGTARVSRPSPCRINAPRALLIISKIKSERL